jgi:hypothetical protein
MDRSDDEQREKGSANEHEVLLGVTTVVEMEVP